MRFIGAMVILLLHIETMKVKQDKALVDSVYYFDSLGDLAVSLFFVLSGFLITFLLLQEKENTASINIKNFYRKRVLRIWPLYFLVGIIGFFIFPRIEYLFYGKYSAVEHTHLWLHGILYFLFLPPLLGFQTIGAAWSVRVEEAFYLVWPLLLRRCKNYFRIFVWVIIIAVLARNGAMLLAMKLPGHRVFKFLAHLATDYRVSCMAIGGMGAYLFINNRQEILSFIYRKNVQWPIYGALLILLALRVHIPGIHYEFYSVMFAFMVLNLATNPDSVLRLDYKWINYLGKVSYGIYLYNPIMRIFCLEAIEHIYHKDIEGWQMNLFLYAGTIASTIIVSILSYEFFEKRFLNMKKHFSD